MPAETLLCGIIFVMEAKDKIDALAKQADISYKKSLILLAGAGGSGSYAITETGWVGIGLFALFSLFVTGVFFNYLEMKSCKKQIKEFLDGN